MILAGDVGGTNARLALFAHDELREPARLEVFPSADFESFEAIVARFLVADTSQIEAASFGVAGPVRDGRSLPVNLRWALDAENLAQLLDLSSAGLVNDLEATALGLATLRGEDVVTLNEARADPTGTVGVIAAGTGLGEAGLIRAQGASAAIATEGGHAGFAPASSDQARLLEFLREGSDAHVSVESVCSGYGLVNIFGWCLHEAGRGDPDWLAREREGGDPAAAVARVAQAGADDEARRALGLFIEIYGSEAGNLALRLLATGGIYVAGGIAGKLLVELSDGRFMAAFTNKGSFSTLLQTIPVHIVVNHLTALLGAARHASERRPLPSGNGEQAV